MQEEFEKWLRNADLVGLCGTAALRAAWNARQSEIDALKAEIDALKGEVRKLRFDAAVKSRG